jgi:hypothetical protein
MSKRVDKVYITGLWEGAAFMEKRSSKRILKNRDGWMMTESQYHEKENGEEP